MAKLSIYKPGKSKDYRFLDNVIGQAFDIAGTLLHCHRYLGPITADGVTSPTTIQDVLLLENRDRKYDSNIIDLKGVYTVNDLDFTLSAFGIMQSASTLFINFHINQLIDRLGRKIIPGDVLEIVHRRDEVNLDESIPYIPAFYVVKDTAKAADGYSATWLPHIWRVKLEPITDSQEYKQILDTVITKGKTLEDLISNSQTNQAITDALQAAADLDVPERNFNSNHLYIQPHGEKLVTSNLIEWQFNNDGTPKNSDIKAPSGTRWPENPVNGDYFLRTDYKPSRLFKRENSKWQAIQDVYRDRKWTPAHRILEDQLEDKEISKISSNPADNIMTRQALSKAIPIKTTASGSYLTAEEIALSSLEPYVSPYNSGTQDLSVGNSGLAWYEVVETNQAALENHGYVIHNLNRVTITLPINIKVGGVVEIVGKGAGGWRIAQNTGQSINYGNVQTTVGINGRIESTDSYDALRLVCITANTEFAVLGSQGNHQVT